MQKGLKKTDTSEAVRLNKFISDAGYCSRREADRLIGTGHVLVDGRVAEMGQKVADGQRVTVDGTPLKREQEMILLAFNKPAGVVCTTDRRWGETTVYDMLNYPKRVFSIGRLDKDSEGLLLLTNYGDIVNKMMRAGNYHEKEYLVTVNREIRPDFLKNLSQGVYLEALDVKTRPCKVYLAGKNQFRIILTQGLNRQIRRMCEALGYKVIRLVRLRVMNIELGDLKTGEYRTVSCREFAQLQKMLRDSKNQSPEKTGREMQKKTFAVRPNVNGKERKHQKV
ncbi:MAG: pseudouridine synthase [Clostridiales bacterium]|nr:pseudouridine synthase [Clostridiales bacterium]